MVLEFEGVGAAAGDRIDLAAIDANPGVAGDQVFVFIGTAPFSGPGQVRVQAAGGETQIQVNIGASLAAELAIQVIHGSAVPEQWAAPDFVL